MQVQDANSGEYLAITMNKSDNDIDIEKVIQRFFWDAARFLKTESFKDTYNSLNFIFLCDDAFESFMVHKFNKFDDFITTYIGPVSKNEDVKSYFPLYYNTIFATRDTSASEKKLMYDLSKEYGYGGDYKLPDNYEDGYLWFFSNFNNNYIRDFSIEEKNIKISIFAENTIESGSNIGAQVSSALDEFYTLSYNNPEALPYNSLTILCIDSSTNATLWTYITDKSSGHWSSKKNTASGDFFIELKGGYISETSDNSSQQENLENESQSPQDNNSSQ